MTWRALSARPTLPAGLPRRLGPELGHVHGAQPHCLLRIFLGVFRAVPCGQGQTDNARHVSHVLPFHSRGEGLKRKERSCRHYHSGPTFGVVEAPPREPHVVLEPVEPRRQLPSNPACPVKWDVKVLSTSGCCRVDRAFRFKWRGSVPFVEVGVRFKWRGSLPFVGVVQVWRRGECLTRVSVALAVEARVVRHYGPRPPALVEVFVLPLLPAVARRERDIGEYTPLCRAGPLLPSLLTTVYPYTLATSVRILTPTWPGHSFPVQLYLQPFCG